MDAAKAGAQAVVQDVKDKASANKLDPELMALKKVDAILRELSVDAAARVLGYVFSKLTERRGVYHAVGVLTRSDSGKVAVGPGPQASALPERF